MHRLDERPFGRADGVDPRNFMHVIRKKGLTFPPTWTRVLYMDRNRRATPCSNPHCDKVGKVHDRGNNKDRARLRRYLIDAHGNGTTAACVHCGATVDADTVSMDRIIPACYYRPQNLIPTCDRCNKSRQDDPANMADPVIAGAVTRAVTAYTDGAGAYVVGGRRRNW